MEQRHGLNRHTVSALVVAPILDVSGLLLYFSVAREVLRGILRPKELARLRLDTSLVFRRTEPA
jgi:hypothetical protein